MNDNDLAPEPIRTLLGKSVRVSPPPSVHSGPYTGKLAAYHEGPVIVLADAARLAGVPEVTVRLVVAGNPPLPAHRSSS